MNLLEILRGAEEACQAEADATTLVCPQIRLDVLRVFTRALTAGAREEAGIAALITISGLLEATAFAMVEKRLGKGKLIEMMLKHSVLCSFIHDEVRTALEGGKAPAWGYLHSCEGGPHAS